MPKSSRAQRQPASGDVSVSELLPRPQQSLAVRILGLLLRCRTELTAVALLIAAFLWVDSFGNPVVTWVVMLGVPAALLLVPHSRRFLLARMWCVLDRHRLRAALTRTKIRTMTRDGSYPYLLWARPTKTGERIWAWLPAGMAATDIERSLEFLAPACFARNAQLHKPKKISTFVAVDIVRRDPLDSKQPVTSPLSRWRSNHATSGTSVTPIKAAPSAKDSHTTDTDREANSAPRSESATTSSTKTATKPATTPAVVVNGEDLSDYVD
ncbi:hypothetical protein GCM10027174_25430 [Salinifilum aidingensis]